MKRILVIGASGFLGKRVALALRAQGYEVRACARDLARVNDLAVMGCEIVRGDISDLESMQEALTGVAAVYVSIHTLSPQRAASADQNYMDVETTGLRNIVTACKAQGVRRLIYVTFLGITPNSPSEWVRGRWKAERSLLESGLDVTVIRPGQIVGIGGFGFTTMVGQARRPIAIQLFGNGRQKMCNIAIDDIVYYLVGVVNDPRTYGHCYDVGCDDVFTNNQMIDIVAEVLGRAHPLKIDVPHAILRSLAPFVERAAKMPEGAIRGILNSVRTDSVGDPMPIREFLPRPPASYRQAVERALLGAEATSA